jgi:hypothetical protein
MNRLMGKFVDRLTTRKGSGYFRLPVTVGGAMFAVQDRK